MRIYKTLKSSYNILSGFYQDSFQGSIATFLVKITSEGGAMMKNSDIVFKKRETITKNPNSTAKELYSEITIGRTTYCITSTFSGEVNLRQTLERLATAKVLGEIEAQRKHPIFQQNSENNSEN